MAATVEAGSGEYAVRHDRLPAVRERFARLARRAEKLGVPAPTFTVLRDEERQAETPSGESRTELWHVLTVQGEAPRLPGGWRLAGTVQYTEVGNIVRLTAYAEEIGFDSRPFREGDQRCDHCQTRRWRRDTYLVARPGEDGDGYEVKVVGSDCVRDFLGHESPEAALRYAVALADLLSDLKNGGYDLESDGADGDEPVDRSIVNVRDYLAEVVAAIEAHGWVPRSKAGPFDYSTAERARDNLFAARADQRTNARPTDEQVREADAALTWLRDHFETADLYELSDYEYNLRVVTLRDWIEPRETGLAASAISYYRRAVQRELERTAQAAAAGPAPRGRADVRGTVTKVQEYEGNRFYNTGPVAKMTVLLENGSRVWTTVPAAIAEVQAGDVVEFRATFVAPPDGDEKFAFGKRPCNARIVR